MPSDQSTWLIAVPNDGDAEGLGQELHSKLSHQIKSFGLAQLDIPSFKVSCSLVSGSGILIYLTTDWNA